MTGNEKRSVAVGLALLVALGVTYVLQFSVPAGGTEDRISPWLVAGVALLANFTIIEVPRQNRYFKWNVREAAAVLVIGTLHPRFAIPLLIVLRAHQWIISGGNLRWKLLTAVTSFETIIITTWLFYFYGILADPSGLTTEKLGALVPWFAVASVASFVVFLVVHPKQSPFGILKSVPVKVAIIGITVQFAAFLLGVGLLFAVQHGENRDWVQGAIGMGLLALILGVVLHQYRRTNAWATAEKVLSAREMTPVALRTLVAQLRVLSPPSSQVLFVREPRTSKYYVGWMPRWSRGASTEAFGNDLPALPPCGAWSDGTEPWNPTGQAGTASVSTFDGGALIQIAPPLRIALLPAVPRNGATDQPLPVESLLNALENALRLHTIRYASTEAVDLPALLANARDGFVTTNAEHRVLSWNSPMVAWTGISPDEAHGALLPELLPNANLVATETHEPVVQATSADGTSRYLQASVSWVSDGKTPLMLHTFRDYSPVIQAAQSRSNVLSHISHEVKTPVANLYLQVDMLEQKYGDDDEIKELQETVQELNTHVNDLRAVARFALTEAEPVLTLTPVPVCEIFADGLFEGVHVEQHDDVRVNVDLRRLQQVLRNLVGNAVKYSGGTEHVRVDVYRKANKVAFRVTDRGIGIPADERDRIFTPYYRASNATDYEGDGIGLVVANVFASNMNGTLDYAPREGGGSVFTLMLPAID